MTTALKKVNEQKMRIEVRDSKLHGLGVFACVDLLKGDVIERCFYLVIDDDDLQEVNGRFEKFCGKMQERYGMSREEAEDEFNRFR